MGVGILKNTVICIQAQTANIFACLFTFETAYLPFQTARLPQEHVCYRRIVSRIISHVLTWEITYFIYTVCPKPH